MAKEGLSVREFARQVGRTHPWVLGQIKAGNIPRNEDGTVPIEEGFAAAEKLIGKADSSGKKQGTFENARNVSEALNKARLAKETYLAKLKEIEYQVAKGNLVETTEVEEDAHAVASALRERLMSIPVRVSGLCEGRTTREIEEILEDAINDALTQFQKSEFWKDE